MKRLLSWMVPGGLVLVAALALLRGLGPEGFLERAMAGYPWVVYAGALLLAGSFHRSRVVVAVLALGATAFIHSARAGGFTALYFSGGVLGLILGAVTLLKDRGILSPGGLLQVGGVLVLAVFGALFVGAAPGDMAAFLAAMPLPSELTVWSGFPQPVFLVFLVAIPTAFTVAVTRKGTVERGVFWSLTMVALALYLTTNPMAVQLLFMAAGLTLGLSVVETSYAMAYRDDLTGLSARRALNRDLDGLGGIYTLAMVDVDHFKKFNDRYGHDVGDQVLRMVATQLAKTPGGGRAYRYGGEEFTLLFPGRAREDTLEHLDRVRSRVADSTFTLRHWRRPRKRPVDPGGWKFAGARKPRRLSVTVSVGVADSSGSEVEPEEVLKKADRALYRAKKAGRNRVAK